MASFRIFLNKSFAELFPNGVAPQPSCTAHLMPFIGGGKTGQAKKAFINFRRLKVKDIFIFYGRKSGVFSAYPRYLL